MSCVKGFYFGFNAQFCHHAPHRLKHAGGIGHDIISLGKVHRPAIKRTDFGQAFGNMGHTLFCADHVGPRNRGQRVVCTAKDNIATHARSQVQHDVHVCITNAICDFAIIFQLATGRAGFGIAHVAMNDGRPCPCSGNRAVGDLFRAARNVRTAILGAARSGHCTCNKDVAVHRKWHGPVLFYDDITMTLVEISKLAVIDDYDTKMVNRYSGTRDDQHSVV